VRLSSWRPVCPECGYSLRRLKASRCPECGQDLPVSSRIFRRWAIRRLPWDRAVRGSAFWAYWGTLVRIVLMPWSAGRSLVLPDRWGRTLRWAAGHLLLAALAGALLGNQQYFCRWMAEQAWPSRVMYRPLVWPASEPAGRAAVWLTQSLAAWAVVLIAYPLLGSTISLLVPGRHRAAKWGGAQGRGSWARVVGHSGEPLAGTAAWQWGGWGVGLEAGSDWAGGGVHGYGRCAPRVLFPAAARAL
jgi:hypothetical protein